MAIDIAGTVLMIVGMVVGGALGDGEGAMWGGLAGQVVTVVAWWVAFVRYLRAGAPMAPASEVGPAPAPVEL